MATASIWIGLPFRANHVFYNILGESVALLEKTYALKTPSNIYNVSQNVPLYEAR